jgi:hypothetical protein
MTSSANVSAALREEIAAHHRLAAALYADAAREAGDNGDDARAADYADRAAQERIRAAGLSSQANELTDGGQR